MNKENIIQTVKWIILNIVLKWQFIALITLFKVFGFINANKEILSSFKAGTFEVSLKEHALNNGSLNSETYKSLKNISEEDLKFFLIMGGEDAKDYIFTNTAKMNNSSLEQYNRLQQDSLIRFERISNDSTKVIPTNIGSKVHKALIKSIYGSLLNTAPEGE